MPAAFLTQGRTAFRDAAKTLVTHIGLSTDATAFDPAQTRLDPTNGSPQAVNLIKAATKTDVDTATFDATISVNGTTELTNQSIRTIAIQKGSAATDALTRSVRSQPIGVQTGDLFTIGARVGNTDVS